VSLHLKFKLSDTDKNKFLIAIYKASNI